MVHVYFYQTLNFSPGFVFPVSEADPTQFQLGPREGVVAADLPLARLLTVPLCRQEHLTVGGAADELEEQPLRRAVLVVRLEQGGQQRGGTAEGNQQGTVNVEGRTVGVY